MPKTRPPKFTPEEFEALVNKYLVEQADIEKIPSVIHFAMFAGISREQLYKYYRENEDYQEAYEKLTLHRDGMTEHYLLNPDESRKGANLIFAAKNYLGMSDKQQIDHQSSDGSMSQKDHGLAVLEALKNKHK